jgi:aerobic C4-dicarboxylate transport protein
LRSLYVQVLLAITIGAAMGVWFPDAARSMKPLGDGFVKLIKMLIGPIIFTTVVVGISGSGDLKKVGRTGGLALLYFEVVSTLALVLGLVIVNYLQPGAGMNIDASRLDAKLVARYTSTEDMKSTPDFLLGIIPDAFFGAFAEGKVLQVLLLAILVGLGLQRLGPERETILKLMERCSELLFSIVRLIMYLAPLGAFGAMAFTIGNFGLGTLSNLLRLMGAFYATCLVFIFVILGAIGALHGFSIVRFLRVVWDDLLLVLGTSSSESALPGLMRKLEGLGVGRATVGLVVPTGYSFNLDGTSIYLTMAAVFLAQATNTPLSLSQQLTLLAVLLLTSKGAAGVTGSGFIVLASTLSAVGTVPVAALSIILGIDRFMSEARALTNMIGNGVATLVVARWTGDLDRDVLRQGLAAGKPLDLKSTQIQD